MKSRILVIGGLAAGPAAATKASRTNPAAEVILFEQGEFISYGICETPYYINNKIFSHNDLILYSPDKLKTEKNVTVKTNCCVREIIPSKKQIAVLDLKNETLSQFNYDKLIIASGSSAILHPSFDRDSNNVFYLKSMQDAIKIKKFIDYNNPKKVAVIGSGFIGIEMADSFASLGIDVFMMGIEDLPLSRFETETREFALDTVKKHKINYIKYKQIKSLEYNSLNNVKKIFFDDKSIEVDMVLIAVGINPNTALARVAKITLGKSGGILVDSKMMTNISNIYAAGDCCEIKNLITNQYIYSPYATTALKTAWTAGENAAGGNSVIKGIIPAYSISFFNAEIAHVGLTLEESLKNHFSAKKEITDGWSRPRIYPGSEKISVILIYDTKNDRILGGEIFGHTGAALRANILSTAIYQKLTLKDIFDLDFVYNPPSTPQRDPILFCAAKALKNP